MLFSFMIIVAENYMLMFNMLYNVVDATSSKIESRRGKNAKLKPFNI